MPAQAQGDVLLAWLVFSDGQGTKRRPVLVVQDFGDDDLLVVPITSQPARGAMDLVLSEWQRAGLKLASTVRVEKLATIEKSCVARKLGVLPSNELARVRKYWRHCSKGFLLDCREAHSPETDRSALHAFRRISFTTRHGFVSVMRSSWPLWW